MISVNALDCRVVLRPGLSPPDRLLLMEVIEKWGKRETGAKPERLLASGRMILFVLRIDRDLAMRTLRQCLPEAFVEDVLIDGVSWNS